MKTVAITDLTPVPLSEFDRAGFFLTGFFFSDDFALTDGGATWSGSGVGIGRERRIAPDSSSSLSLGMRTFAPQALHFASFPACCDPTDSVAEHSSQVTRIDIVSPTI